MFEDTACKWYANSKYGKDYEQKISPAEMVKTVPQQKRTGAIWWWSSSWLVHTNHPMKPILGWNLLSDPGVPGVRSMGPDVSHSLHTRLCADLTDVTMADEDTKLKTI